MKFAMLLLITLLFNQAWATDPFSQIKQNVESSRRSREAKFNDWLTEYSKIKNGDSESVKVLEKKLLAALGKSGLGEKWNDEERNNLVKFLNNQNSLKTAGISLSLVERVSCTNISDKAYFSHHRFQLADLIYITSLTLINADYRKEQAELINDSKAIVGDRAASTEVQINALTSNVLQKELQAYYVSDVAEINVSFASMVNSSLLDAIKEKTQRDQLVAHYGSEKDKYHDKYQDALKKSPHREDMKKKAYDYYRKYQENKKRHSEAQSYFYASCSKGIDSIGNESAPNAASLAAVENANADDYKNNYVTTDKRVTYFKNLSDSTQAGNQTFDQEVSSIRTQLADLSNLRNKLLEKGATSGPQKSIKGALNENGCAFCLLDSQSSISLLSESSSTSSLLNSNGIGSMNLNGRGGGLFAVNQANRDRTKKETSLFDALKKLVGMGSSSNAADKISLSKNSIKASKSKKMSDISDASSLTNSGIENTLKEDLPQNQPKTEKSSELSSAGLDSSMFVDNNLERIVLNNLNNGQQQKFDINQDKGEELATDNGETVGSLDPKQISTDSKNSIWVIISNRYIKTGFSRLLNQN